MVSVSRTPGHTKHFQTIFLTRNVCLCDCPGLVFPSTLPKQFQILMGSFPIAQVREPYTTIKFLAERVDLQNLLKLQHQSNDDSWSAMDICESWAAKKNYHTAKAARLDTYRAANSLLRMALDGKICIFAYPPKWSIEKGNSIMCHLVLLTFFSIELSIVFRSMGKSPQRRNCQVDPSQKSRRRGSRSGRIVVRDRRRRFRDERRT